MKFRDAKGQLRWCTYWFAFDALPVTLHLKNKLMHFHWTQLRGVQIGPWFFGAIKGKQVDEP